MWLNYGRDSLINIIIQSPKEAFAESGSTPQVSKCFYCYKGENMNIFLPYEHDIDKSVESLDDRRLIKQILECYQLLSNAIKEKNGEQIKGYKNHPIYLHYKKNISFLIEYGIQACREYRHRFQKKHNLYDNFIDLFFEYDKGLGVMWYVPFYMQGSKDKPDCIRTTHYVSKLYQNKLCEKWDNDKAKGRPPKWTNREIPSFYKESFNYAKTKGI